LISIFSLFFLAILLFMSSKLIEFPVDISSKITIWYFLVFLWSLIGLYIFDLNLDINRALGFFVVSISSLVSYKYFKVCSLEYTLKWFVLINLIFFYVQLFSYYIFDFEIDYLVNITGEKQRMFGGTFQLPYSMKFIRPTGLYQEPGTYATFLAPMIALFGRYSTTVKNNIIFFLSIGSLFFTFSVFGILFGTIIVLFSRYIKSIYKISFIAIIIAFSIPYLKYRFFTEAITADSSLDFRIHQVVTTLKLYYNEPFSIIFGSNLLSTNPIIKLKGAHNDSGLILYLMLFLGPFLSVVTLAILIGSILERDRYSKISIFVILISKISIFMPFFPFMLNAIMMKPKHLKKYYKD
jgi:hypothetical protein